MGQGQRGEEFTRVALTSSGWSALKRRTHADAAPPSTRPGGPKAILLLAALMPARSEDSRPSESPMVGEAERRPGSIEWAEGPRKAETNMLEANISNTACPAVQPRALLAKRPARADTWQSPQMISFVLEVLEGEILWPRWAARIGVTRSTQACILTAGRQCTEVVKVEENKIGKERFLEIISSRI